MNDWQNLVTMILTFDPETGEIVIDRGPLPRMFALAILANIDVSFRFSDEQWADCDECAVAGDDDE